MKMTKLAALVAVLALLLFVALPNLSWAAEDGAALYKTNCAGCHKADGSGNPAMKAPALTGKSAADVEKGVTSAAKHPAKVKGLTAEQSKAIAAYVATLKK